MHPRISDEDKLKLLPFQIPHTEGLIELFSEKQFSISGCLSGRRGADCSDTGIGKTATAVIMAKTLKLKPLIVCPLSVVSHWFRFLEQFGCEYYGVANYEKMHNCKYYNASNSNEAVLCPYIEKNLLKGEHANEYASKRSKRGTHNSYKWHLPADCLLIFDEAHRCKNPRTLNSVMLFTAANTNASIMLLSATLADKPENFALAGYVLWLYPSIRNAKSWITLQGKGLDNPMLGVHKSLFPACARRIRIKDLGALFPSNTIIAECYNMETAKEIEEQYAIISQEVERLKTAEDRSTSLAAILYARMRIEQLRIPWMLEMARQLEAEGNSVPIFCNFTNTVQIIAEQLGTKCIVYGQQSRAERDANIALFQADKEHFIICNIDSGKEGISLQDRHGDRPRCALISPTWNATSLKQALGRCHRAEGRTPVRQWIPFCKDTIEEHVCRIIKAKLENLGALNDGDLGAIHIPGLTDGGEGEIVTDEQYNRARVGVLMERRERLLRELAETDKELKAVLPMK